MQLQKWANENQPDEDLIYKDGYWDQIRFVRDKVPRIFAESYDECKTIEDDIQVISDHTSKSVKLPVFQIRTPNLTLTMRNNFHDWKLTVSSISEIKKDFMGLIDMDSRVSGCCCEGFPDDLICGSYADDGRKFTVELPADHYHLFTFLWILGSTT